LLLLLLLLLSDCFYCALLPLPLLLLLPLMACQ